MKNITVILALIATLPLVPCEAAAQPDAAVTAWSDVTVDGTDIVIFEFERNPGAGNTSFVITTPDSEPADFALLERNGAACRREDPTACGGSFVSPPPASGGTFQILDISETAAPAWFRIRAESDPSGRWTLRRPTSVDFANATFGFVHTLPDVSVDVPDPVPAGSFGVVLDASGSHAVFEGMPQSPTPIPAIQSFGWRLEPGSPATITPSASGETATFSAPRAPVGTEFIIEVTVDDGTLRASELITVTIGRPEVRSISIGQASPRIGVNVRDRFRAGEAVHVGVGGTVQLVPVGILSDGSQEEIEPAEPIFWRTSNPTVATVNRRGLLRGARAGTASITASTGSFSATTLVTVAHGLFVPR